MQFGVYDYFSFFNPSVAGICSPILPGSWEVISAVGKEFFFFFFLYEWEHRAGTMYPFSSLHP